eukprot:gene19912-22630_t
MLASFAPLLTQLHLRNLANEFYDADVDFLVKNFPLLTDLALNSYQYISNTSMMSIARNLPQLQRLSVFNCSTISDDGVILIAKHCQQLQLLSVAQCDKVTDKAMREIWQNCTLLTNLQLNGCTQITDAVFADRTSATLRILRIDSTKVKGSFLKQACNLTELYCNDCLLLGNHFVQNIILNGSNLAKLFFNSARLQISELLMLSQHLPRAENVGVSYTQANDAVVLSFVKHCSQLRWICALDCGGVTAATAKELKQTRKLIVTI